MDLLGRGFGDRDKRGVLADLVPAAIETIDQRRTGWAGIVPVRAVHKGVEQQGVFVAEQLGEFDTLPYLTVVGPLEDVVFFQLPAERERAPLCGNGFYLFDELLFVLQQCVARIAILAAFIRIPWLAHVRVLPEE